MSESEESDQEEGFDGVAWDHELEDDSLAEAQAKLENEFGADFEEVDYGSKGFARRNDLPFYTEVEDTIEINGKEVQISVERDGGLNTVEFWVDDREVMETVDRFLEKYTASNGGETMLEPYLYEDVQDTDVRELLVDFSSHFELTGPERRPGNGQPREYPIRRDHIEDEVTPGQQEIVLGNSEEQETGRGENSQVNYTGNEVYIPGDAQFQIQGIDVDEGPNADIAEDVEVEGQLTTKPLKRDPGLYDVKLKAEDKQALTYIINRAEMTL